VTREKKGGHIRREGGDALSVAPRKEKFASFDCVQAKKVLGGAIRNWKGLTEGKKKKKCSRRNMWLKTKVEQGGGRFGNFVSEGSQLLPKLDVRKMSFMGKSKAPEEKPRNVPSRKAKKKTGGKYYAKEGTRNKGGLKETPLLPWKNPGKKKTFPTKIFSLTEKGPKRTTKDSSFL